jgi:hypothetical protein
VHYVAVAAGCWLACGSRYSDSRIARTSWGEGRVWCRGRHSLPPPLPCRSGRQSLPLPCRIGVLLKLRIPGAAAASIRQLELHALPTLQATRTVVAA